MPYISEIERKELDDAIEVLTKAIQNSREADAFDFSSYLGKINYCFSRVIAGLMGRLSYKNIAMITGVLENIKQEFYRRAASPYEDNKILANGDIPEYRKLK
jgi:hypothetical protein